MDVSILNDFLTNEEIFLLDEEMNSGVRLYAGQIERIGIAPDYKDFICDSAVEIKSDRIAVKIEKIEGTSQYKVSLELTIDWEDPTSGFSSVDEFSSWISSSYETSFCLYYDFKERGEFYIDIPRMQLTGGKPSSSSDKEPLITFQYEGLHNPSFGYTVGMLYKREDIVNISDFK